MNENTDLPIVVVHFSKVLLDLSTRIARLAIGLRIPLNTETDVQDALNVLSDSPAPAIERRVVEHTVVSPERRTNQQRSELRGLLVMRFEAEAKMAGLVGAAMSRQVLESVAENMERHGFRAGSGDMQVINNK
jgi:hypothetical protein